ncbi:D-2-hydroxyacid dehydrogenase [Mitsuaria sp. GD03876]|uniref:D-2-hydroxyacid dehydrogenase n=1 Tax=Mitsuaria sp. GD03876 TaxID=2975399 RepID=UPI0024478378|nr:D-2-hydroxyacid dehydrogenase [Mitsuaria sp. GD03876]MDH0867349.1 D-2-hydroxyacid dehydrogenase [Mitsuaria sp. GD03876]
MISLLLSAARAREHADALRFAAHAEGETLRLVTPEDVAHVPTLLEDVQVAWYTLDLLEGGSPTGPASRRFFALLQDCPALRWLHVMSAGTELPMYEPVRRRGVLFTTGSGIAAQPVAHSAVAAVMALSRGFGHWTAAQQRREWSRIPPDRLPRDLPGQHAVVIGLGPIGLEIARLLRAVGLHVTGVRSRAQPADGVDRTIAFGELAGVIGTADWLIVCCPLSDLTRGLVDRTMLASLPMGAGIVNVSRGAVIDEPALRDALTTGRVGAAYLDVFEQEPLAADSPFWSLPNVWISPHNAAASRGNAARELRLFVRNLGNFLAGRSLENAR